MAGETETLEKPVDGVCTLGSDAELNDDVGLDGSVEEDKDVNSAGEGAAGALVEGSVVLRSLEGESENGTAELDGHDATLDEQKSVVLKEENKMSGEEIMSDVIEVELGDKHGVEGQADISEQIVSHREQEVGGEEFNDAKKRKTMDGKVLKRASMKSSGKNYQVSYQLPPEKEGEFPLYGMVWGKVRSHPWWPGQIFDPSDASALAMKHFKKGSYLVAYYGDGTFAWNEASQLKPFRTHFSSIENKSNSDIFRSAVDCAMEEVTRRVEFGLACSCIHKDTYDKIKVQVVENVGIREELSVANIVDESLNISSFSPEKLIEYLKTLSELPTGGFDRLELSIAKAQLLAFYRLKGYSYLPQLQYCGGLENDIDNLVDDADKNRSEVHELATHVSKNDGQSGTGNLKTENGSCNKHKHNLKDVVYTRKKKRFSEPVGGTSDSTDGDIWSNEVTDVLITPSLSKKRKTIVDVSGKDRSKSVSLAKVSNTAKQSFKIGDCIRRVASQLTGPSSMLKCSGAKSQIADEGADDFSGNGTDVFSLNLEEAQKSGLIFHKGCSSLGDLLSSLQWVAHEPQGDYSFLNVIVSFFSDFRNSITVGNDSGKEILPTNEVGTKRKKPLIGGSPETCKFDDLGDTYLKDMVIQVSRRRRSYSTKRYSDSNHVEDPEKPSGYIDEESPAELVSSFSELDSVPSETSLSKIFRHFGPLKESETEIDRESSRARVVFKKRADAEVAFSSAKKFNLFGSALVNYQLNYTPGRG
ncbi:PWWP domain-containing protein 5-like [Lotus japonicus]|uniref:PWWP domain-containing protein 5-like n=1 Tax=Lotus japonicus TaxID=34305 RepID=UPI00258918EE|nr:PWWP domain-containing protein 5-like [Lotus japonicus]XP_057424363.1 PWWP domain-containing protein 5-like [Lotus japonicus]